MLPAQRRVHSPSLAPTSNTHEGAKARSRSNNHFSPLVALSHTLILVKVQVEVGTSGAEPEQPRVPAPGDKAADSVSRASLDAPPHTGCHHRFLPNPQFR